MLRVVAFALLGLAAIGEPLAVLCNWECSSMQMPAPAGAQLQLRGQLDCSEGCLLRKVLERQAPARQASQMHGVDLPPLSDRAILPVIETEFFARGGPGRPLAFPSWHHSSVVLRI